MGKNVFISGKDMTDEEQDIGDFRGWHTAGDVFLDAARPGDDEQKRKDEEGYSYYPGPYVITSEEMRAVLEEARRAYRREWSLEDTEEAVRVDAFVALFEQMEREGREPTLWFCV